MHACVCVRVCAHVQNLKGHYVVLKPLHFVFGHSIFYDNSHDYRICTCMYMSQHMGSLLKNFKGKKLTLLMLQLSFIALRRTI